MNDCGYCSDFPQLNDHTLSGNPVCFQCASDAGFVVRREGEQTWLEAVNNPVGSISEIITENRISRLLGKRSGIRIMGVCELVDVEPGTRTLPNAEELAKRYRLAIQVPPSGGRRVIGFKSPDPQMGENLVELIYADEDEEPWWEPGAGGVWTAREREIYNQRFAGGRT